MAASGPSLSGRAADGSNVNRMILIEMLWIGVIGRRSGRLDCFVGPAESGRRAQFASKQPMLVFHDKIRVGRFRQPLEPAGEPG